MTKNRALKRMVRARMSITGEPYSLALRVLTDGRPGYWRSDWFNSGWMRLLPVQATPLEIAVTTATVHGAPGTLERALADSPASIDLPDGASTSLTWSSVDDDADTAALRTAARKAFESALHDRDLAVPTTVAELAVTLAEVGIFERVSVGRERIGWRSPEDLPEPSDILCLPDSWLEREDHVRWRTTTSLPADTLRRDLFEAGQPQQLQTTIDALAELCSASPEQIRDGLDGLLYRGWATTSRHGRTLDRRQLAGLPGHARFQLDVTVWTRVDDVDDADEGLDLSTLRWQASPWSIYRVVAASGRVSDDAIRVLAELPFEMTKPTGGTFVTTLGSVAAEMAMSVPGAAKALSELDDARWLTWDGSSQLAKLEANRRPLSASAGTTPSSTERAASALNAVGGGATT